MTADDPSTVWHMWAVFAGVAAMIGFYASERYPMEVVSAVTVAATLVFFHFFPMPTGGEAYTAADILAGFSNPALITIMALLIVGQGMFHTGALEWPARRLAALSERRPVTALGLVFASVFITSAFLNNTPVVVMFIPITAALAARMGHPASRVMMPLSFICILAGMTTLIGSSTNLLVADALAQTSGETLAFFDPLRLGLPLAGVGLVYLLLIAPRLLPHHTKDTPQVDGGGRQFIAQIDVTAGHPLVGKRAVAGHFTDLPDMTVRMIQRGERALLPPFDDQALQPGDAVIVAATRATLSDLLATRADFLQGVLHADRDAEIGDEAESLALVEAVVAPGARVIGRTLEQAGFRSTTGVIVLGVQRRSRMVRAAMSELRLEAGDVLLLFGARRSMQALRQQRDVLPLEQSATDVPDIRRAARARGVFAAVVLAAATGAVPILHAAFAGAIAMVVLKCLNLRQAARAFDLRIYLLIGAAFALGGALEATGGAQMLASGVVTVFEPFGALALLSALFLVTAVFTNVLSNSATAILFTPVAVEAGRSLGVDPAVFALAVLYAANCSFATPIAYQTNLLVMGPGHYSFRDFVRVGAPLVVVMWIAFTLLASWAFGL